MKDDEHFTSSSDVLGKGKMSAIIDSARRILPRNIVYTNNPDHTIMNRSVDINLLIPQNSYQDAFVCGNMSQWQYETVPEPPTKKKGPRICG